MISKQCEISKTCLKGKIGRRRISQNADRSEHHILAIIECVWSQKPHNPLTLGCSTWPGIHKLEVLFRAALLTLNLGDHPWRESIN